MWHPTIVKQKSYWWHRRRLRNISVAGSHQNRQSKSKMIKKLWKIFKWHVNLSGFQDFGNVILFERVAIFVRYNIEIKSVATWQMWSNCHHTAVLYIAALPWVNITGHDIVTALVVIEFVLSVTFSGLVWPFWKWNDQTKPQKLRKVHSWIYGPESAVL